MGAIQCVTQAQTGNLWIQANAKGPAIRYHRQLLYTGLMGGCLSLCVLEMPRSILNPSPGLVLPHVASQFVYGQIIILACCEMFIPLQQENEHNALYCITEP